MCAAQHGPGAEAIREKLADAAEMRFPQLTWREANGGTVAGKARAVIGMRRAIDARRHRVHACLALASHLPMTSQTRERRF